MNGRITSYTAHAGLRSDASDASELSGRVIGAFFDVYDALGYGFLESVYAEALSRELVARGIAARREVALSVRYRGEIVGAFRADLLVESRLMLELKAGPSLTPADRRQLLNYLRCSDLEIGLLLGFCQKPLIQRVVASRNRTSDPGHRR